MKLYLLLCVLFSLQLFAQSKPLPFADDPRLKKAFSFSSVIIPLSELTAELSKTTAATITVSHDAAELKAALVIKGLPTSEVMEAIATSFDLTWARSGEAPNWSYSLYQARLQKEKIKKLRDYYTTTNMIRSKKLLDRWGQFASMSFEKYLDSQLWATYKNYKNKKFVTEFLNQSVIKDAIALVNKELENDDYPDHTVEILKNESDRLNEIHPDPNWIKIKKFLVEEADNDVMDLQIYIAGYIYNHMSSSQKIAFWEGSSVRGSVKDSTAEVKLPNNLAELNALAYSAQSQSDKLKEGYFKDIKPKAIEVDPSYSKYMKDEGFSDLTVALEYIPDYGIMMFDNPHIFRETLDKGYERDVIISKSKFKELGLEELTCVLGAQLQDDHFFEMTLIPPKSGFTPLPDYTMETTTLLGDLLKLAAEGTQYSFLSETTRYLMVGIFDFPTTLSDIICHYPVERCAHSKIEHTDNFVIFHPSWMTLLQRSKDIPEKEIRKFEMQKEKKNGVDLLAWRNFLSRLTPNQYEGLELRDFTTHEPTSIYTEIEMKDAFKLLLSLSDQQLLQLQTQDLPYSSLLPTQSNRYFLALREEGRMAFKNAELNPKFYGKYTLRIINNAQEGFAIIDNDKPNNNLESNETDFSSYEEMMNAYNQLSKKTNIRTKHFSNKRFIMQIGLLEPRNKIAFDTKIPSLQHPNGLYITETREIGDVVLSGPPITKEMPFLSYEFNFPYELPMPTLKHKKEELIPRGGK